MDATTYQAEFGRTLAPVFFPENVNPVFLGLIIGNRDASSKLMDAAKRALFYNKTDRLDATPYALDASNPLGLEFQQHPDDVHAILGMESEVSEITDAIISSEFTDEERRAKIIDESGDFLWYLALLFKRHGITFEEVFDGNIAKLKKRYPGKFSVEAAVNRDLEVEAAVFH